MSEQLTDEGRIIEAGWQAFRILSLPPDAPQTQLDRMREAFFAGAQHLLGSIMSILDPGEEPTERDMRRMASIQRELEEFIRDFELRHLPAEGRG